MKAHFLPIKGTSFLGVCFSLALCTAISFSAPVKVSTVAGGYINDGKAGPSSALQLPTDIASDSKGNLYITDGTDQRIRELNTKGILKTIAGTGIAGYSGDGGLASKATMNFPRGIVVDSKGNIIFCDAGNNRIRKISTTKIITTIAGTGVAGYNGDGIPATTAELNSPIGLSLDSAGNLYFADAFNQRIREIDTSGIIHTLAGNGTPGYSGNGGQATAAELNLPKFAISDNAGNLYIADQYNNRIRIVNSSGVINDFAGTGKGGCKGDGGPALSATLGYPRGMVIWQGSLYVATIGCSRIRQINLSTNIIQTVDGSTVGFDGNGHLATASQFDQSASGIVDNTNTHAIIVDAGNNQIRSETFSTGIVTGIAGGYLGDGLSGTKASLNAPENIAFDAAGNMYIADLLNHRIRKMTSTGIISTFAGTGISGYTGDGGPATSAELYFPFGVAVDKSGNVYISDNGNGVIRVVPTSGANAGKISTFVQNANFFDLLGLATDSAGNVYIADDLACVVWQVTPASAVSVVAGVLNTVTPDCGYNADGIAATSALLNNPAAVTLDSAGNLYIGDLSNNRVRKVSGGIISTVAGNGTCGFFGDNGPATSAMLCNPQGVAVDSKNNLFIGDYSNARVRKVTTGTITTLAGTGNFGYNGNGLVATSTNIDGPAGLAVNSKNVLYVADDQQYRVRKIH